MKWNMLECPGFYVMIGAITFYAGYFVVNMNLPYYFWSHKLLTLLLRGLICGVVLPLLLALSAPRPRWQVTTGAILLGSVAVWLIITNLSLYSWRYPMANWLMVPTAAFVGYAVDRLFAHEEERQAHMEVHHANVPTG